MKISFTISITFLCSAFGIGQDTWVQRDSVNGAPKSVGAVFTLSDDAYFLTGLDQFDFKRTMYKYDITQDDWDDAESLGGLTGDGLNRGSAIAFSVGGYGFCGLGSGSVEYFKDLWRYDGVTNSWTQMADFEGTGRREAVAFVVNDFAFVGTGQDNVGLTNDFWKYDHSTNMWTQISDFPGTARRDAVGISMAGQGYVGTGVDAISYKSDFYAYYPLTDTWVQKADFPGTPRHGSVGFGLFPTAFLMTGEDNTFTYKKDVWEYNYFGDSWTQRSNFPGPARSQAIAIVVQGRAFVGTGYNGILYDDFWEYTPILSVDERINLSANIYPNPATNEFFVDFMNLNSNLSFKIFDEIGREITSAFSIQKINNNRYQFQVSEISTGMYYLCMTDDNGNQFSKSILLQ